MLNIEFDLFLDDTKKYNYLVLSHINIGNNSCKITIDKSKKVILEIYIK